MTSAKLCKWWCTDRLEIYNQFPLFLCAFKLMSLLQKWKSSGWNSFALRGLTLYSYQSHSKAHVPLLNGWQKVSGLCGGVCCNLNAAWGDSGVVFWLQDPAGVGAASPDTLRTPTFFFFFFSDVHTLLFHSMFHEFVAKRGNQRKLLLQPATVAYSISTVWLLGNQFLI